MAGSINVVYNRRAAKRIMGHDPNEFHLPSDFSKRESANSNLFGISGSVDEVSQCLSLIAV
jgi:hypothetical protein